MSVPTLHQLSFEEFPREKGVAVYIGRNALFGNERRFDNPILAGRRCGVCETYHLKPSNTLYCFERYMRGEMAREPSFRSAVKALWGKKLFCSCRLPPDECHGSVLIELCEELNRD